MPCQILGRVSDLRRRSVTVVSVAVTSGNVDRRWVRTRTAARPGARVVDGAAGGRACPCGAVAALVAFKVCVLPMRLPTRAGSWARGFRGGPVGARLSDADR
ncbi:hypothetical protein Stsp02_38420 [Streptomyces sp. NBRC 14336]|nr:hypothetical protein Stsp02_38420 [Streptomyces sp. NBRC 14336]